MHPRRRTDLATRGHGSIVPACSFSRLLDDCKCGRARRSRRREGGYVAAGGTHAGEIDAVALALVVEDLAFAQIDDVNEFRFREPAEHLVLGMPGDVTRSVPVERVANA